MRYENQFTLRKNGSIAWTRTTIIQSEDRDERWANSTYEYFGEGRWTTEGTLLTLKGKEKFGLEESKPRKVFRSPYNCGFEIRFPRSTATRPRWSIKRSPTGRKMSVDTEAGSFLAPTPKESKPLAGRLKTTGTGTAKTSPLNIAVRQK